jgi:cytochrome c oxidase cbb3-type subunit 3
MTPPPIAATSETDVPATTQADAAGDTAKLLEHAYDGIREYDNPLPGWWRAIFWTTIVFAAGYWVWFHVADLGQSPDDKYRAALSDYANHREEREAAEARDVSEEMLASNAHDPKLVDKGRAIFATKCVSCHTEDGHGLIGPNLTDRFQIHGTTRMDIYKTISGGVSGTAMLAWGEQMPATDIVAVATFVTTLRGKDVPGKAPQGQPVEPFK